MRLVLLIILILLLIGAFPVWPYSASWGFYPASGMGFLLVIALVFLLVAA